MADEIDKAQDTDQLLLGVALRNYKHSPIIAESVGHCLHCGVDLPAPRRWCDAICRDLWQDSYR